MQAKYVGGQDRLGGCPPKWTLIGWKVSRVIKMATAKSRQIISIFHLQSQYWLVIWFYFSNWIITHEYELRWSTSILDVVR